MSPLMKFRRKSKALGDDMDAGPMVYSAKRRQLKVYAAGDELVVERMEDLPGYPNAMDGWKFLHNLDPKTGMEQQWGGAQHSQSQAVLKAVHQGGDKWKVVVDRPGFDYLDPKTGDPMARNLRVHPGFVSRDRAEKWVETNLDPGIEE